MSELPWIADEQLDACINELKNRISNARKKASVRVKTNVSDPFWLLCIAEEYQIKNQDDLLEIERCSSVYKGVASALGNFHQQLLGNAPTFDNIDDVYDVESAERKILAEIKNKHNTMNSDNRKEVKRKLNEALCSKPDYTGYLVIINPKKPERYKKKLDCRLEEVDGATFYELATGYPNALQNVYEVLMKRFCADAPQIRDVIKNSAKSLPK